MSKEEHHQLILETLMHRGSIPVSDLSALLEVSAVTIRKDLTDLENAGKLYRSHGKAVLIDPYIAKRSNSEKEKLQRREKELIGREAATMVRRDDSIIVASGTTMLALARFIVPDRRLTVISSSLAVSQLLGPEGLIDLVQLGGSIRHSSLSVVGTLAEEALSGFACNKLFLGVDGIDVEFGLTTTDIREAELNRAMMRTARKIIVLADSSKFRRRGFSKIANITEVDTIITDSGIPDTVAQQIRDLGIDLRVVPVD